MFEADSLFDNVTALSIASLVGNGGGLFDLSVMKSGPSCGWRFGVRDRVCRSLSDPSLVCACAEDSRRSSAAGGGARPAQSPDIGRVSCSGEPVRGVRAPDLLVEVLHECWNALTVGTWPPGP